MNRSHRHGHDDRKTHPAAGATSRSLDAGAEPPEGFADYEDYGPFEGYTEDERQAPAPAAAAATRAAVPAAAAPAPVAAGRPVPKVRTTPPAPATGFGGWRWGVLAGGTAAAIGAGAAAAMAVLQTHQGGASLPQPAGGAGPLENPRTLLLLVSAGSAVLAGLMGWKIATVVDRTGRSLRRTKGLLSKVAALRLDKEEAWQDPSFADEPSLANFAAETLGAWRHQEVRLRRMVGIEGELHRLEKALSANSRDDIAGHFETPVVGILSDSILKIYDEAAAARQQTHDLQAALARQGQPLLDTVQDARGWQRLTHDHLNLQQTALEKTAAHLAALAARLRNAGPAAADAAAAGSLLQDIRRAPAAAVATAGGLPPQFNELLDRFTKLAFQIAMEVARLGQRGERLLPMAQSLEDLTAAFRQAAEGAGGAPAPASATAAGGADQAQWLAKIDALAALVQKLAERGARDSVTLAERVAPATGQVAANLLKIAGSFDAQHQRLTQIGKACAELTTRPFDPAADRPQPDVQDLAPIDPFLDAEPQGGMQPLDPFLGSAPQGASALADGTGDFISGTMPGVEDTFTASPASAAAGRPEAQSPLSQASTKVYDLREFGAVRVDRGPQASPREQAPRTAPQPAEARIYDLAEFGAVRLDAPAAGRQTEERIYDLSEFGARRVG